MTRVSTEREPAVTGPRPHAWTFDEYVQLRERGVLGDRRTELIDGEILDMSAQRNDHLIAVSHVARLLMAVFPPPRLVGVQSTHKVDDRSAPEPDVFVLPQAPEPGGYDQPTPLLIVEVSDSTLQQDRGRKAHLYALRGVADYWVVNLRDRCVEVYREPGEDASSPFGWRYGNVRVVREGDSIAPLAAAGADLRVSEMLP